MKFHFLLSELNDDEKNEENKQKPRSNQEKKIFSLKYEENFSFSSLSFKNDENFLILEAKRVVWIMLLPFIFVCLLEFVACMHIQIIYCKVIKHLVWKEYTAYHQNPFIMLHQSWFFIFIHFHFSHSFRIYVLCRLSKLQRKFHKTPRKFKQFWNFYLASLWLHKWSTPRDR